ncbi:MAG: ThiF family adenylyltransferase [Planctomycetaceae bacterium]
MTEPTGFDQSRYRKQMLFHGVGTSGQAALKDSRVLLVGCGALGCVLADAMVRAGVGFLRIADRDFVELSNLQRQSLFTEADVNAHLPKAIAAVQRLRQVNSEIEIDPVVTDVNHNCIRDLAVGMHLILDGTDNFEIRYLINDLSLETGIPWIFTGCTGSHGQMMPVFPHVSGCLRCLMPEAPPPGSTETCDTAGVLGPAIGTIASLQAAMALRILIASATASSPEDVCQLSGVPLKLTIVDVWDLNFRQIDVSGLRSSGRCPACHQGERRWLNGSQSTGSTVLCGRNAVQVTPPNRLTLSLAELEQRLAGSGRVTRNAFLLRLSLPDTDSELTVFPDGRAIIRGTEDPAVARALYSRYIGS